MVVQQRSLNLFNSVPRVISLLLVGGIFDIGDNFAECQKSDLPYVLWIEVKPLK